MMMTMGYHDDVHRCNNIVDDDDDDGDDDDENDENDCTDYYVVFDDGDDGVDDWNVVVLCMHICVSDHSVVSECILCEVHSTWML